jgi:two-component system CheB/CheR fusion protein
VHELATNAIKYGALSNGDGMVDISWREKNARLVFGWRERGGPTVAPPGRRGFGTTLIERALQQKQGAAHILFDPAGVVCSLEMTL